MYEIDPNEYYTTGQVAFLSGLERRTVSRLCSLGILKAIRHTKRLKSHYRVKGKTVNNFITKIGQIGQMGNGE